MFADPRIHRLQSKVATLAEPIQTFAAVLEVWRDFKVLMEKLNALPENSCLKAVVVLDADIFASQNSQSQWTYHEGASSFFYFISQLHDEMTRGFVVAEPIWKYGCEITDTE